MKFVNKYVFWNDVWCVVFIVVIVIIIVISIIRSVKYLGEVYGICCCIGRGILSEVIVLFFFIIKL